MCTYVCNFFNLINYILNIYVPAFNCVVVCSFDLFMANRSNSMDAINTLAKRNLVKLEKQVLTLYSQLHKILIKHE